MLPSGARHVAQRQQRRDRRSCADVPREPPNTAVLSATSMTTASQKPGRSAGSAARGTAARSRRTRVPAGARCYLETVDGAPARCAVAAVAECYRVYFRGSALDGPTLSPSDSLVVLADADRGTPHYYALTWARAIARTSSRALGSGPASRRRARLRAHRRALQQVPPYLYDIDVIIGAPGGPA